MDLNNILVIATRNNLSYRDILNITEYLEHNE